MQIMILFQAKEHFFRVYIHLNTRRVGRIRDSYAYVSGLHNFREFTQPPSV